MTQLGLWLWNNADRLAGLAQLVVGAAAVLALLTTVVALRGTAQALGMQRDELRAIQSQLDLENRRFARERRLARPRLRIADVIVRDSAEGRRPTEVKLRWSYGTDPADDLEVWLLTQAHVLYGEARYMGPADHELLIRLVVLPGSARELCPFPWRSYVGASNAFWVGVTWRRTDGERVGFSEQVVDHHPQLMEGGIDRETVTRNPGKGPEVAPTDPDDVEA